MVSLGWQARERLSIRHLIIKCFGNLQDLLLLLELLLFGAVLSQLHNGSRGMLNIIKTNSPSEKLPDGHPFTLVCKILNVNFFKSHSCGDTSSFWTLRVRILSTKLCAVSTPYRTNFGCAAIAPVETVSWKRQWWTTSQWSECLHALLLLLDDIFNLLNLFFIPFEGLIVFLPKLRWIWTIFCFGVGPHSRTLSGIILFVIAHTWWRLNLWWPVINFCSGFDLGQSLPIEIIDAVSELCENLLYIVFIFHRLPWLIVFLRFFEDVFGKLVTKILQSFDLLFFYFIIRIMYSALFLILRHFIKVLSRLFHALSCGHQAVVELMDWRTVIIIKIKVIFYFSS